MRLLSTVFILAVCSFAPVCFSQDVYNEINVGTPPTGLFHGGEVDTVQTNNGNLHIEIPLWSVKGRGPLAPGAIFVLDTKEWTAKFTTNKQTGDVSALIRPEVGGTLEGVISGLNNYQFSSTFNAGTTACWPGVGYYSNEVRREPNGTKHHLVPDPGASCPPAQYTIYYADDGSGITNAWLTKDGVQHGGSQPTDTNGNFFIPSGTGAQDTLARALTDQSLTYYDSAGTAQTIQFSTTSVTMNTHLCQWYDGWNTCTENTSTYLAISQIRLPNGMTYAINYVQNDMGEPSSITLPSGAQISWTYNSGDEGGPAVATRKVTANGQANTWTYNYAGSAACASTGNYTCVTSILDPLGNETDLTYTAFQANYPGQLRLIPFVTLKKFNDKSSGASVLVKTEQTDYSSSVGPVLPIRVTTTWNQPNLVSKVETDYDSFTNSNLSGYTLSTANPIARREYDWATAAPGSLLRRTAFNYLHLTNSTYVNANILDRVTSKTVYDSTANTCKGVAQACAQTTYFYDSNSITSTSSTPAPNHDYTGHGSTFFTRGNLTVVCRVLLSTNTCLNTTNSYDDLGNLRSTTDPNNNVTSFSYTDNFTDGINRNAQAFVTQVTHPATNGVNHIEKKQLFWYTSLVAASCGQNFSSGCVNSLSPPQPDYAKFTYDNMFRPLTTTRGDGGTTTFSYNDTVLPLSATTSVAINSSLTKTTTTLFDDLDRLKQTQLTSDPQGIVYVDTTYDALGRTATVSNPYRSGGDITTTTGITTYFYDALGRKCLEAPPDGTLPASGILCPATQPANDLFTVYSGTTTTVTDQTGKSRKSVTDGLGHLTQVFEDPAGLNYETDYSYDALDNLLTVNQKGGSTNSANWRTRTFTYDSLSRLLTSNNPEVGTITYKHDADSNCASPNSYPGLLISKTDARGIRTCSQFDALDRETVRNYSNSDPTLSIVYDQSNCLGLATCQNIGHRTSMTDAAGSEIWAFDSIDRVHKDQRTTNSSPSNVTKTTTYSLDYADNTIQATYPTGRIVNYTFDAANRPSAITDGSNGITYATGFKASPGGSCLVNVTCYTPQGTFYALSLGQSTAFPNGMNLTHKYNSRLQPLEFQASSAGGNAIDISYSFVDPITSHNAGHVYGITNNIDGTRSQKFTYDSLNRLTGALTTSTFANSPSHCWGESYALDPWGNLQSIAATSVSGYTGCVQESGFSKTADGNNHLSGFSYDLAGNTSSDGTITYSWDGESQLKSAINGGTTTNYLYDGDGRRVSKVGSKLYWYDGGGQVLAETDASGNTTAEYIYFGGQRIATLPAGSNAQFYVEDMLGTSRVLTTNTGVVCYDADFYSFGGERTPYTNTCPQNAYKFEGKERDAETGNDDFGARYYSNRFGRWLSADWSSVPAPVPYANLANPQTLSLYSMVSDDPETFEDLDGHCPPCEQVVEKLIESPEGQELIDRALGPLVQLAVTGYAASQGLAEKAAKQLEKYAPDGIGDPNVNVPQLKFKEDTTQKGPPNPDGSKGASDHQDGVKQAVDDLQKEAKPGETVESNKQIKGHDSNRRPDAQIVDENGQTRKVTEVERHPESKRNRQREEEYDKLGVEHETRPLPKKTPKIKVNRSPDSGMNNQATGTLHEQGGPN